MTRDEMAAADRPTILVVDDDPHVLASLIDELSEQYGVTPAADGEAALEALERQHFDAVVSDVRMPGISGVEVIRRAFELDRDIVRILLTGYSDDAARVAAATPGGAYKLGKPWGEEFGIVLRRALEQRQAAIRSRDELMFERTVREQTEQAISRLSKMAAVGTLVAGVAHELRSPLACLTANLQALPQVAVQLDPLLERLQVGLESATPDGVDFIAALRARWREDAPAAAAQEIKQIGADCLDSTHRLQEIVDGLRTYSAPARRARYRAVELERCVARAVRLVASEYKRGVTFRTAVTPGLGGVIGHEGEIIQVLVNLMLNAVQAMGGRGTIDVRVRCTEKNVLLEVEDSGPGVPEDARARLFQPFFTTKPDALGNGLGLWLSREIAVRHGGDLRCVARPPPGALFVMELPISRDGDDDDGNGNGDG